MERGIWDGLSINWLIDLYWVTIKAIQAHGQWASIHYCMLHRYRNGYANGRTTTHDWYQTPAQCLGPKYWFSCQHTKANQFDDLFGHCHALCQETWRLRWTRLVQSSTIRLCQRCRIGLSEECPSSLYAQCEEKYDYKLIRFFPYSPALRFTIFHPLTTTLWLRGCQALHRGSQH